MDGCGYRDSGHEGLGASILTDGDASPVLGPTEVVLDLVALLVEVLVLVVLDLAVLARQNAQVGASLG